MTVAITEHDFPAAASRHIEMQGGDTVIMYFTGEPTGRFNPNAEDMMSVRVSTPANVSVAASESYGERTVVDERTAVAKDASTTHFYVENAGDYKDVYQYVLPKGHVMPRRIKTWDKTSGKVTVTEPFQERIVPTELDSTGTYFGVTKGQYDAMTTGDEIYMIENGGYTGIADGTTYYVVKRNIKYETDNHRHIALATTKAHATATNPVTVGISGSGLADDVIMRHSYTPVDGLDMEILPELDSDGWPRKTIAGGALTKIKIDNADSIVVGQILAFYSTDLAGHWQVRQVTAISGKDLTLDSALSATSYAADWRVELIQYVPGNPLGQFAEQNFGHAVVETSVAPTTTKLPLKSYDSAISASHDVLVDGVLYDIASVDSTNKTITLTTALAAIPDGGTPIEFKVSAGSFWALAGLTAAASTAKVLKFDTPVAALKFVATAVSNSTNKVNIDIIAPWLPEVVELN